MHASRAVNPVFFYFLTWKIYKTGRKAIMHGKKKETQSAVVPKKKFFPAGAPSGAVNPATYAILYRCTLLAP